MGFLDRFKLKKRAASAEPVAKPDAQEENNTDKKEVTTVST